MTVWKNCTMDVYPLEDAYDELPGMVEIDGSAMGIEHKLNGKRSAYTGLEERAGHYRVQAEGHPGRGTLDVFPADLLDEGIPEGLYDEDQQQGMGRIHLAL